MPSLRDRFSLHPDMLNPIADRNIDVTAARRFRTVVNVVYR
jgi:hypothetical protein